MEKHRHLPEAQQIYGGTDFHPGLPGQLIKTEAVFDVNPSAGGELLLERFSNVPSQGFTDRVGTALTRRRDVYRCSYDAALLVFNRLQVTS